MVKYSQTTPHQHYVLRRIISAEEDGKEQVKKHSETRDKEWPGDTEIKKTTLVPGKVSLDGFVPYVPL